ncbi:leukocyte-specific transcript 1 protein isoform X3 [Rhinolophus ferrumequinum]|uniref:leukocyte-specific transcript 1 protein isoform X3 n=1 Tax=Rhinolophus ferrumequinum TaxID=59479 RepID=UPI00140FD409|nr:leukocyte-specific transcript 1 protein isoform X3 [Rhinolophus ferrumequinum]
MQVGKGLHREAQRQQGWQRSLGGARGLRKLERSLAQVSVQELHYASLQRLPCGEGRDLGNREREGSKEDPSSDYTCIYQNKTT